jgi:Type II secretory pathway, prepilin signal peptidase PulO and related peptidases
MSIIDWKTRRIPYRFQAIILALGVISLFISDEFTIKERLIGMLIVSIPMSLVTFLSSGFGGADIQLTCVAGFLLGYRRNVVAIIIALFLAAIVGVILSWTKRKTKEKVVLPFVPFLSIGFVFSLFIGDYIFKLIW